MPIALYRKAELATYSREFRERNETKLWATEAKIAHAEGETAVGIEFRY